MGALELCGYSGVASRRYGRRSLDASRYGRVAVWACRAMGVSRYGRVALRACRGMGVSRYGRVALWACRAKGVSRYGHVALWACRGMGVSRCGRVALWACRAVGVSRRHENPSATYRSPPGVNNTNLSCAVSPVTVCSIRNESFPVDIKFR